MLLTCYLLPESFKVSNPAPSHSIICLVFLFSTCCRSLGMYSMPLSTSWLYSALWTACGGCPHQRKSNTVQPVDRTGAYSTSTQTDILSPQCLACFLRAAGRNVFRGPWLGEAGCPGFQRSDLALGSVVSILRFLSQGHPRHSLALDFLAFNTDPIQEVPEILIRSQTF